MSKEPLSYILNIYLAIPRFLVSKIILHIFWDLESPMNSPFQISIHLSIICTTSSTQSYLAFLINPFPRFSHICSFQKKKIKRKLHSLLPLLATTATINFCVVSFSWPTLVVPEKIGYQKKKKIFVQISMIFLVIWLI